MQRQYYEGVLQLRNPNKKILDFVKVQIKKNPKVFIAKESKLKNGVDLYLSSQKFLFQLGKKLKQSFKGQLKISRKLFTRKRQTGKRIYRVNILFKHPHFKKAQTVQINGEEVKILQINNMIKVQNIKTGKKSQYSFEQIDKAALLQH